MRGRKKLKLSDKNRQSRRTLQNRINKRNQRIRIKNKENISPSLTKKEQDMEYVSNLINYFNTYEFDIHFTGTFEPKQTKKISLQSLKSYTDKFIQLLIDGDIIEYGLVYLDTGENENNHTHILIKTNPNIKNINKILKSKWLLGRNVEIKVIETENYKLNSIKYGFKNMGQNSSETMKTLWNFITKQT
jgi:hypothetical protein